jgi:hypothetical protein
MNSDTVLLLVLMPALFIAWKDVNARWLMLTLLTIQLVDMAIYPLAVTWVHHFYIWCVLLNAIFIFVVLSRRQIALRLYVRSRSPFLKSVIRNHTMTTLECALLLMYVCGSFVSGLVWIEIQLYSFKVISTPYLYHYFYSPALLTIHILEILAVASYITRLRNNTFNIGALNENSRKKDTV